MPRAQWGKFEKDPFSSELDEFDVYEGEVPRGTQVFRLWLKGLRLKSNRNNDPMLNLLLVVKEPKGSKKAQFNGYGFWANLNVTEQGAGYVNNFLEALAGDSAKGRALRKAFWDQKVMLDKDEPPNVVSIGTKKIAGGPEIFLKASCRYKPASGDYDETLKVLRYMAADATSKTDEEEDAAEAEEGWEEPDAAKDELDGVDEDEDEDFNERADELEGMTLAELKKILKEEHDYKVAALRPLKTKESVVEEILALEFPEDEDSEEDSSEDEPEEDEEEQREAREAELAELDKVKLKAVARKLGTSVRTMRDWDEDALIEHILNEEFGAAEEEEAEPPVEEPKRPARSRTGRRKATAADEDEPPF